MLHQMESSLTSADCIQVLLVQQSGLLNHLTAGDMILADKGFLIQDIVPHGVCVNITPFLNNGTFT